MDFILQERAVYMVGLIVRKEIDAGLFLEEPAGAPSQSPAPTEIMTGLQSQVMQEIKIEGIARFAKLTPDSDRAVKIGCEI